MKAKRKAAYKATNWNRIKIEFTFNELNVEAPDISAVFSELSTLSLKHLSKQAMNNASAQVPHMEHFEITEEGIRKVLLLKTQLSYQPWRTTAMGS